MKYPAIVSKGTLTHEIDSFSGLVSAPGPYMEFGEFIYLEASSTDASATLRMNGKFLSTDGEIRSFTEDMVITGTGNQTAVTSRIGPCWLMGFSVRVVAGTITDGEVVCSVHIARASASTPVHVMTLASGEVTNTRSLGLGGFTGASKDPSVVPITPTIVAVSTPAVGAEWTKTVPAGVQWQLLGFMARVTFGATVASRDVFFTLTRSAVILQYVWGDTGWVAGTIGIFGASVGGASLQKNTPSGTVSYLVPIPAMILQAGDIFGSQTTNLQADDQWSGISLSVLQQSV